LNGLARPPDCPFPSTSTCFATAQDMPLPGAG
jgi:hypothetical protein